MKRGLLGGLFALGCLPVWAGTFHDIQDPFRQVAAEALHTRRIMPALAPDEFGASNPVTRYDLAEILDTLLDPRELPFQMISFADMPPGGRQTKSVNRLVSFGIMKANGGTFEGNKRVTRVALLETLDRLLAYRAIPRPPRRKPSYFPDVKKNSPAYEAVDRAANYWTLLENPEYHAFRPYEAVTRGEAAEMIARAAALIDPSLVEHLKTPEPVVATPVPTPVPSVEVPPQDVSSSGGTETPSESASPKPSPTPIDPKNLPLLRNDGHLGHTYFMTYDMAPTGGVADGGISTLQGFVQYWGDTYGGNVDLNSTLIPGQLSDYYSYTNFMMRLNGFMKLPWKTPEWESAAGLGVFLRMHTINAGGNDYFTNPRSYFGLGPSFTAVYCPTESFHLLLNGALYPLMLQSAVQGGIWFGTNLQVEGRYDIIPNGPGMLSLHAGLNGQYDLGYLGGLGTMTGIYFGLGQSF